MDFLLTAVRNIVADEIDATSKWTPTPIWDNAISLERPGTHMFTITISYCCQSYDSEFRPWLRAYNGKPHLVAVIHRPPTSYQYLIAVCNGVFYLLESPDLNTGFARKILTAIDCYLCTGQTLTEH